VCRAALVAGERVICAGCSGDLLPPSPPAEKATARQDQARQASPRDGAWDRRGRQRQRDFKRGWRAEGFAVDQLERFVTARTGVGRVGYFECSATW
jgi:hypothetical protein